MDKFDHRILNTLKENGRETASDISRAIHLPVSAVLDCIEKMEESGIIKGYMVRVNARVLGNDVTASMEISLEHPRLHDSFMEAIMDRPNIPDYYYPTGDYNFAPKISCASSDELEYIHRAIKNIPGISATRTRFVLREIKNMYSAIPEEEKKRF